MKRPVVVIVGALLGVGALALVLWWLVLQNEAAPTPHPSSEPSVSPTITVSPSPSPSKSLSPTPTPTEGDPGPTAEPTDEPFNPAASSTIPGASAVLTLANWDASAGTVLVGGFVSGVMEDGGTCLFTVTASDTSDTRSVQTQGAFNVDSTTCGSHDVEVPNSQTGQFRVRLVYSNSAGTAMSDAITVETK